MMVWYMMVWDQRWFDRYPKTFSEFLEKVLNTY